MLKEIKDYEVKMRDLYYRLEKANKLVGDLRESKQDVQNELDRIAQENQQLIYENRNLHKKISDTHASLSNIKELSQSPLNLLPHTNAMMKDSSLPTLCETEANITEEISADQNFEQFLKQISELKQLCSIQGNALVRFQETMEGTQEDNDRLKNVLFDLENEKKEISDIFASSDLRSSQGFDFDPGSPVLERSPDSSMFISTLDAIILEKQLEPKRSDTISAFHRPHLGFIDLLIFKSHIPTLTI